jgi:hypothetical protein
VEYEKMTRKNAFWILVFASLLLAACGATKPDEPLPAQQANSLPAVTVYLSPT